MDCLHDDEKDNALKFYNDHDLRSKVQTRGQKVDCLDYFHRIMYSFAQQNKCYPQRCLLAHFEANFDCSLSEFICP